MASPKTILPADADVFLARLEHPLKAEILQVRDIVLGVDPSIREAVKWNAPSYRTTEFFATFHLRSTEAVRMVLHTGAKARETPAALAIPDPDGLLEWLAKDRAMLTLRPGEIAARRPAVEAIVRAWIAAL